MAHQGRWLLALSITACALSACTPGKGRNPVRGQVADPPSPPVQEKLEVEIPSTAPSAYYTEVEYKLLPAYVTLRGENFDIPYYYVGANRKKSDVDGILQALMDRKALLKKCRITYFYENRDFYHDYNSGSIAFADSTTPDEFAAVLDYYIEFCGFKGSHRIDVNGYFPQTPTGRPDFSSAQEMIDISRYLSKKHQGRTLQVTWIESRYQNHPLRNLDWQASRSFIRLTLPSADLVLASPLFEALDRLVDEATRFEFRTEWSSNDWRKFLPFGPSVEVFDQQRDLLQFFGKDFQDSKLFQSLRLQPGNNVVNFFSSEFYINVPGKFDSATVQASATLDDWQIFLRHAKLRKSIGEKLKVTSRIEDLTVYPYALSEPWLQLLESKTADILNTAQKNKASIYRVRFTRDASRPGLSFQGDLRSATLLIHISSTEAEYAAFK